jgi:folate-binding Fe-S cluster repair protein YgfZ
VDGLEDGLPQEGSFAEAVWFDKGRYRGQEAVTKVRNLRHPRRNLLHLAPDYAVSQGDVVEADGEQAGEMARAAAGDGHRWLLVRVRWEERDGPFRTTTRVRLNSVPYP